MIWLIALFFFVVGAVVGSFINVLIYRTIKGEDWVMSRSRCDHCLKPILWIDNLPLLSYLILKGKCRYCHQPISIQHPLVELMAGLLFSWWYLMGFAFFQLTKHPLSYVQPLFWLSVGILLLIILIADYLYMIIPDYAVIILGLLSLFYRFYLASQGIMQVNDFYLALVSGFIASAFIFFLWWITKGKGMGFGDVKYVLVMGWLLGFPKTLVSLFIAFTVGALVGIGLLLIGHKKLKTQIPFGPFLVLGTMVSLLYGLPIWQYYTSLWRP